MIRCETDISMGCSQRNSCENQFFMDEPREKRTVKDWALDYVKSPWETTLVP